uniref:zona pellucida sperm-binding protein 3-like n=1 Tax=Euleptes europaea TaxID=460621 RepID=UPI0025413871|nr:zona pellucida sperm-binding protein 3-like [Euleptes europaea]
MVIHRGRDPEVMVETFELDNPGFRSLAEPTFRSKDLFSKTVSLHLAGRMGCSSQFRIGLLCFMGAFVASYDPWDFSARRPGPLQPPRTPSPERRPVGSPDLSGAWAFVDNSRALSAFAPVSVQCGEAQVAVAVKRDLFGTGRLVQAADLSLGSSGCKHTALDAAEEAVVFEAGLHECGSTLQMTPDSLVYSIRLYYKPTPGSNPVIIRTSAVEVPIECHYPRKKNVSSKAIKPTWVPFSSTLSAEERLVFSLHLMNEDWSAERTSKRYQLGEAMNLQADVNTVNHVALKLFVDNCVATLSPDRDSSPRYSIIDFHGCLVDGRSGESSSAFVSPRTRPDSLQFTVDAFRFAQEQADMIYITCHLKVIAGDQTPDVLNKACSFHEAQSGGREEPSGKRLLSLSEAHEKSVLIMMGLTVTTGVLALVSVVLASLLACRKRRRSDNTPYFRCVFIFVRTRESGRRVHARNRSFAVRTGLRLNAERNRHVGRDGSGGSHGSLFEGSIYFSERNT